MPFDCGCSPGWSRARCPRAAGTARTGAIAALGPVSYDYGWSNPDGRKQTGHSRSVPPPSDADLVAIDVAKAHNEVFIELPGKTCRRRLTVPNTRAAYDRFIGRLQELGPPAVAGFEATSNYYRPLAWRLLEAGYEVRLIYSVALARTREALHNGWDKNDPKNAQVILPHAPNRREPALPGPTRGRHQRHPGAVEDARADLEGQDGGGLD